MQNLFYIDNDTINRADTVVISGNVIKNIYSDTLAVGIRLDGLVTILLRDNQVSKCRSATISHCTWVSDTTKVNASFNALSRANFGLSLTTVTSANIYNLTVHNCDVCNYVDSTAVYRNVVLSAYNDNVSYKFNWGFAIPTGASVNVNYLDYFGIGTLYTTAGTGTFTLGTTYWIDKPLYKDEPNDDLMPDHVSLMIKNGVAEPRLYENPSVGGVQSFITSEITAPTNYYFQLLDNSFWDIDNDEAGETCITRACQSRVLANSETALYQVQRDYYIKTASSLEGFSALFPMNSGYLTPNKFKKAVTDMWFATSNACTTASYERSIGGYNLFPTFIDRLDNYPDYWIINVSYISQPILTDLDNWLLGMDEQMYGIGLDVLGVSTLTSETYAECYANTQKCISDIAPVKWFLHQEVQPVTYLILAKWYNSWDQCELTNMIYNEDDHISIYEVQVDGTLITPNLSTARVTSTGNKIQLATFDRLNSENVTRTMYYRLGNNATATGAWTEIIRPIGEIIDLAGKNLYCCASDADGSNLIVGMTTGRLWTSVNSGVAWTERRPSGVDASYAWSCCASDDDGSNLIAGSKDGRLWTSLDSGATWTERRPGGVDANYNWTCCASDNDGSALIAGINGGRLWTSANSGVAWTERRPSTVDADFAWSCCASDNDGTALIAGIFMGRLWTSANSGVAWTERKPSGATADFGWYCCASDSDGTNLIAGIFDGRLWTSVNSGVAWTERKPSGVTTDYNWCCCASDDNGSNLTVGAFSNSLWISIDTAATWTERKPSGSTYYTYIQFKFEIENVLNQIDYEFVSLGIRAWVPRVNEVYT